MSRSQLDAYGGSDPIWGFVTRLGAERFSGRADIGIEPRVHVYATEGRIYFAERDSDPSIDSRFVSMGVLSDGQLERGAVHLGGTVSLARLFTRDPSVDRDAIEVALEKMTAETLEAIASEPVGTVALFPLRHHASGIHQWRPLPSPTDPAPEADDHVELDAAVAEPEAPRVAVVTPAEPSSLPTLGTWTPPSAEERQKTAEHRFTPMDFTQLNLPKLANQPMSVGEITAAQAVVVEAPVVEAPATGSIAFAPLTTATSTTATSTTSVPAVVTTTFAELLRTPASNPVLEPGTDIETLLTTRPPTNGDGNGMTHSNGTSHRASDVAFDSSSWSPPVSPLSTADEIWEMVDEMLGLHHEDTPHSMAGGPGDKKTRGWRRGKKG